jgi:hypothetical protein
MVRSSTSAEYENSNFEGYLSSKRLWISVANFSKISFDIDLNSAESENFTRHLCRLNKKTIILEHMNNVIQQIYEKKESYVCRNTGDELLLIPLKDNVADFNQYLTLNEVGAFIWKNIEMDDDESFLVAKICTEFEADESEVLTDLQAFLEKLRSFLEI